jgi:sugar lactone lactonase YvrE
MITGLAVDGYGRLIACDYDGGQLFVYDLATRALVARRALPAEQSWPNDVAVAGDTAYVTDTRHPLVWRPPAGRHGIGDPHVVVDLSPFGPADPAYLNGIVAHPREPLLLAASQGEGGTLWRIDVNQHVAVPVDLGGYEYNADGMLLDGDVLYGVTNRGGTIEDTRFMISAARLAPGWRAGTIVGELADPGWDCPTTIAKVDGKLLVVCSQVRAMQTKTHRTCPSRSPLPNSRTGRNHRQPGHEQFAFRRTPGSRQLRTLRRPSTAGCRGQSRGAWASRATPRTSCSGRRRVAAGPTDRGTPRAPRSRRL